MPLYYQDRTEGSSADLDFLQIPIDHRRYSIPSFAAVLAIWRLRAWKKGALRRWIPLSNSISLWQFNNLTIIIINELIPINYLDIYKCTNVLSLQFIKDRSTFRSHEDEPASREPVRIFWMEKIKDQPFTILILHFQKPRGRASKLERVGLQFRALEESCARPSR
ncbi:hypothetical protein PRIPAC_86485 [Pristionchus pacificus]|uniref:Uncharacterized protein n=1 Tax=Pristionchus pacificus TaxID=54126 RepID=A0A2A6BH03_PRIPA|nr:hypothetical protein PRIPAC_86485 [Pristionchus pacificus]|eukprot:PDM65159.1 hypothetical protein PRIPAC_53408 [Pristionchus pacificus]